MSLIKISESINKKYYTREEDEVIVKMKNEGKSYKEISELVDHSLVSVQYRVNRVLSKVDSFDDIKYKN